ncbi:FAD binding domain of DNA photolyase-domain-containing protein [Collybia nuda]|uniref:FAD binding domain of DNA photolyase-domain-containing protein n=1 Tax=Collybia nuda TaxID=64659 RepID=A0A9P6CFR7_9AGAR|nr:FAD binding domain of DNA photolyase-domain-containing protein [Collybia nuda]
MPALKHTLSIDTVNKATTTVKRARANNFVPIKIATASAAAAVDADPPLQKLLKMVRAGGKNLKKGSSIVYWMRMGDLRISDNRALSLASQQAQKDCIPLVVLFVLSPQDYKAHDRSARRIDFVLRNLRLIKASGLLCSLAELHIPLHVISHTPRKSLVPQVVGFVSDLGCASLYANIEYEVDELRRDIQVCEIAKAKHFMTTFVHNKCIVDPGVVLTKEGKSYSVYSPYLRNWMSFLNGNIPYFLQDCPRPRANTDTIYKSKLLNLLFDTHIPIFIPGFELQEEDLARMREVWPAGEDAATKILEQFLFTRSRSSQIGAVDPLAPGAVESSKSSRIFNYDKQRDRADRDTTSRISPYLSAGVLSPRACVRATMLILKSDQVDGSKNTGIGHWVQELAWRDFYTCVLTGFPRISMGRPFLEKYSNVVWESHQAPDSISQGAEDTDEDSEVLKKWKEGTTGVPIVDAAMRCLKEMGWIHNRMRMITAMFLTKDLMIDWRVGERYFMEQLIDGDLASNNGGWQWSASTGVDPCPYFRIFNPYTQSLKADPTGEYIRHWVPELRKLMGSDLHNPSASVADKLGYPKPIVKHDDVRHRALRRFKNPGEE